MTEVSSVEDSDVNHACARTLAEDPALDLTDAEVRAPVQRGCLDALALRHLYHDTHVHQSLSMLAGSLRPLLDAFEQERYESIGSDGFRGVRINLDARWTTTSPAVPFSAHGAVLLSHCIETARLGCRAALRNEIVGLSAVAENPPSYLLQLVSDAASDLRSHARNQKQFGEYALQLLKRWVRLCQAEAAQADYSAMAKAIGDLFPDIDLEETELAQSTASDNENADDSLDTDSVDDESTQDESPVSLDTVRADPEMLEPDEPLDEAIEGQPLDQSSPLQDAIDEAPVAGPDPVLSPLGSGGEYRVFTTDYDEVSHASAMQDRDVLIEWRAQLDRFIAEQARVVRRLAARLQRVLLAQQQRDWQFDLEDGQLDTARLTRVVISPSSPLSFKRESDLAMRDTTITLLIDNSRSMLGRPIMIAAACADILCRTMERCGVTVEVLGFTTSHLHGGRSTERWESQGSPASPGRLNDLKHIIYKSADSSYRSARHSLALMLDRDLLKQNIDGESLAWAHQRLVKRPEQRKILMMISDGAPVDSSTLSANADDYLVNHLQSVVAGIEKDRRVELLAIGIGHDVSRYYAQAMNIYDSRQLGKVMLEQLETLLAPTG